MYSLFNLFKPIQRYDGNKFVFMRKLLMNPCLPGMKIVHEKVIYSKIYSLYGV